LEIQNQPTSKIRLLEVAKKLFWKFGIKKVTVEELCREGGLSKMTFYRYFKNKDDVARQLMSDLLEVSFRRYRNIMHSDGAFEEKVRKLVRFKYEAIHEMSDEFIKDVYQYKDGGLLEMLDSYRQKMYKEMRNDFTEAQKNGWIRKDVQMDFIMYMLNDMNNKILDPNLVALYESEQKLIMEMTNFFFYGILSKS
jgi:AcrR family transcriptional regulator